LVAERAICTAMRSATFQGMCMKHVLSGREDMKMVIDRRGSMTGDTVEIKEATGYTGDYVHVYYDGIKILHCVRLRDVQERAPEKIAGLGLIAS